MMSTGLAILNDGRVEQDGAPHDLYLRPATRFVASFLGESTLIDGALVNASGRLGLKCKDVLLAVESHATSEAGGQNATLVLPSEVLRLGPTADAVLPCDNRLEGRVSVSVFQGSGTYYEVDVPSLDVTVRASVPRPQDDYLFERGDRVWLGWSARSAPIVLQPLATNERHS
jgi:ABC-type Fe3+/spermidine/putrescine transport system ATPase subunit